MRGDQLKWHWEIPNANPFASGIRHGWDAGFGDDKRPKKLESDVELSAYDAGVEARQQLITSERHFTDLRVYLLDDEHVGYELSTND